MKTNQFISINRIIILALVAFIVASYSKQSNDFLDDVYRNAAEQLNNEVMDKTVVELSESGQVQNISLESSTNHSDEQVYINETIHYLNAHGDYEFNNLRNEFNYNSGFIDGNKFLKVFHDHSAEFVKKKQTYIVARDEVNY